MGIIAGSGSRQSHKVFITESGKEVNCGLGFTARSTAQVLHPLYVGDDNNPTEEINGVRVVRPMTKLQRLDEQKEKFEAGYWDKFKWPGPEYVRSLVGCGFPPGYLSYYSEVKKVDKVHFKRLYHEPILECMKREYEELKKYDPYTAKRIPDAEGRMKLIWGPDRWSKYE